LDDGAGDLGEILEHDVICEVLTILEERDYDNNCEGPRFGRWVVFVFNRFALLISDVDRSSAWGVSINLSLFLANQTTRKQKRFVFRKLCHPITVTLIGGLGLT